MTMSGVDGLRRSRLKAVWSALVGVLVVLGIVSLFVVPNAGEPTSLGVAVMVAVSVTDLAAMVWFRRLGTRAILAAESNEELRSLYTRRVVMSSSFALSPVIVGFALSLAFDYLGYVAAGIAVALPALLYSAPRRSDVIVIDEALIERARPFRLSAALGD